MNEKKTYSVMVGQREYTLETGHLAEQAGGAVTLREGDTMMFATATMSKSARQGIDFFPLSVDLEERLYAAGRIPGSWFRREGRPSSNAILVSRMTDRPLRPLFPKGMRNEVQIVLMALAHDQEHQHDIIAINAASAALHISNIPWGGPIGAVRVGLIDGNFVVNPTYQDMENSVLDLRMAGTADAVIMVECGANEVDEETMVSALEFGHNAMQPFIQLQEHIRRQVGKEKDEYATTQGVDEEFRADIEGRAGERVNAILAEYYDRDDRKAEMEDLREQIGLEYSEASPEEDAIVQEKMASIGKVIDDMVKKQIRARIVHEGVRPDGRDYTSLRALSAEVGMIPRSHGTGLFQRGQTQVMSFLTLGTPRDAQEFDELDPLGKKRYLHHYNFPPYSTGETWFLRGPKRREIGHGMLAENALLPVLPDEDVFPYTMRVVSEVLSSNGSTSMASVCASTLALMDGGVPIRKPVGGIAMGLIMEGDQYAVLTDIQGMGDHIGDMDFKVAGTRDGITALQMDIKITGVSRDIMAQALNQALDARLQILDVMTGSISEPRADLADYAPRILIVKIDPEKIRNVIGKGGETIRGLQTETNTRIDIEEDGTVYISSVDGPSALAAKARVESLTESVELGRIYTGTVVRTEPYGAFVQILPGQDGLVHISQLDSQHVASTEDVAKIGDEIMVMVTDIGHDGKIRLSRQAVLEGWTLEEAKAADKGGGGSRGGSRGGRGGDRRGGGNRGGGDRR